VSTEGLVDIGICGSWIGGEQRGGGHDHSRLAVTALRNLAFEPRALDRMLAIIGKSFDRSDLAGANYGNSRNARTRRFAIDVNRTGAAQSLSAPKFGSRESKRIPEHPKERSVGSDFHSVQVAVYGDRNWVHLRHSPCDAGNFTFSAQEKQFEFAWAECGLAFERTHSRLAVEQGKIRIED
jgi:hypothetical protein